MTVTAEDLRSGNLSQFHCKNEIVAVFILVMPILCKGQNRVGAQGVHLFRPYEQALVCLSNREIVDASRGRTFHCKMANNRSFSLIVLA